VKKIRIACLSTLVSAGLLPTAPAIAQSANEQVNAAGHETVIITARKRPEDAQVVPISVSAFTQTDLDRLNIKTIEDLKFASPSLYIAPTTFRQDTLNITIRGQRDFDSSSGQSVMAFDTASAVYMDGVYMARPIGLNASLFDVENIAVLKGPQGTLVGRNSTGGAILYQTRQPVDHFEAYAKVTGGDYGRGELQGAVNIPFAENLFFRAAVQLSNNRGYISNLYFDPATGARNNQPSMGSNRIAGNFSLKYVADDSFNVVLRANISAEHDTGSTYHNLGYFVGTAPFRNRPSICNIPGTCSGFTDLLGHVIAPYYTTVTSTTVSGVNTDPAAYNSLLNSIAREQTYGFWSTEQAVSNLDVGHYQTVSAVADKNLGDVDVKLLTAYRWWDNTGTSVSRGLPYATTIYRYNVPDYQSYQTELTVNGTAIDNTLIWTAGLFFFQEESPRDGGFFFLFLPSGNVPTAAPGRQITITDLSRNGERNTSYAGYAQATYSLLPDTRLTAGIRYTYDERFAHMATQTIITPASTTTTANVVNGVFDPTPYVLNGISYSGQTHACALTDTAGKLLPLSACSVDINRSFHKPTWTLALEHDLFDGTLVYATSRSGYRSGAINTTAINPAVIVARPENVTDYEIGIKSDWELAGMPIRTNFAGYFSDYHDIQILTSLPNVTIATAVGGGPCTQAAFNANNCVGFTNDNVTLNAKTAHIFGTEWDINIRPIPQLTLSASGSYIDAVYTDYTFTPPAGYLLPAGGASTNLSGTPFPLPRWQTNETARYATGLRDLWSIPIDDLTLTAHYYWQSRYLADLRNFNPAQRTSSYGFLDLRLDVLNIGGNNLDLAVFMKNVLNTEACLPEYNGVLGSTPQGTFGIPNTAGVLQCVPLPPRQTGLTLGYKF
jgi:iron complex outermembrane receptor protein